MLDTSSCQLIRPSEISSQRCDLVATAPSCLDKVDESEWTNQSRAQTADSIARMIIIHSLGVQCSVLIPFGTWCLVFIELVFILLVLGVLSVWFLVLILLELGAKSPGSLTATEWLMALCSWSSSPLPSPCASLPPPPSPSPTCS